MELISELETYNKHDQIHTQPMFTESNTTIQWPLMLQVKRDEWKHEKLKYRSRAQRSRVILPGICVNIEIHSPHTLTMHTLENYQMR